MPTAKVKKHGQMCHVCRGVFCQQQLFPYFTQTFFKFSSRQLTDFNMAVPNNPGAGLIV